MADNWHQNDVALVSDVVVNNETLGRRTENLLLDLVYACCNHLLFEVFRRHTRNAVQESFECTMQVKCLDAVIDEENPFF